ncbi:hypothetical protein [Ideonella sp.]|uniref:hypothetical protein n=1 Tax=Ideonella sp. TaxID=1929293 RepID=UPI003BB53D6C
MLYRALLSTTEHAPGHNPLVWHGEYYVFIEIDEESENMPGGVACARFAQHFGVQPSSVTLIDIGCEDELAAQALGPAHPAAWRWFENGITDGQPSYIRAEQLLILVDDQCTADMMLAAHTELMEHQAAALAEQAYDDQVQQDLQMDEAWYGMTVDPEIDQAERTVAPGLQLVSEFRTHARIGRPGRHTKPVAGAIIKRVLARQARADENRRVAQAGMSLPPAPLGGRNARTFRARLDWALAREQMVFRATFGLAMAAAFTKVPA